MHERNDLTAVLFDFGGVIVDSPFQAFAEYERANGLPENFLRQVNSRNPDTNAWAELERGRIDAAEFGRRFADEARALGHDVDAHEVLALLEQVGAAKAHARPDMVAAVDRCRSRGLRVGLLTNNVAPMSSREGTSWVHDHFDAVIESCVVGLRKPDAAFYELACERVQSAPPQTVLLDDLGINLKPARALGMHTIKVVDPIQALEELDALLMWTR